MENAMKISVNIEELKKILDTACIGKQGRAELSVLLQRSGNELTVELKTKGSLQAMHVTSGMLLADLFEKNPHLRQ